MRPARVVLGCVALVVAGCGGGSSSSSSSGTKTTKPAATSAPASASAAKSAVDAIKSFTFTPHALTVSAGATVTWTNKDSANHNVTFSDKSVKSIPNLRQNQSGKISFAKAGTYKYVCTYHPGMAGIVVVK